MNNWNCLGGLLGNQSQRQLELQTQEFQSELYLSIYRRRLSPILT